MGRTPVASGSSVPPWPALAAPVARRTLLTTAADVRPAGLSITSQPLSALPRRRSATSTGPAFVMVPIVLDITRNRRIAQDSCDAIRLLERSVDAEGQVRGELQVDALSDTPPEKALGARQSPQHRGLLAAAERHDEDRRLAQVGAESDLRDGDGHSRQHRIANFPAFQDASERVTQLLADTQLSLTDRSVHSRHGGLLAASVSPDACCARAAARPPPSRSTRCDRRPGCPGSWRVRCRTRSLPEPPVHRP